MKENQPTETIDRAALPGKAAEMFKSGQRLVVITCTVLPDSFDLVYSFDKDYAYTALRVAVPRSDPSVPSITGSYFGAFAYENELQDLFGINVPGLVEAVNFKGNFYRKAAPAPFLQGSSGGEGK
jgi:ech hydrogenase subunit D